MSDGPRDWSPRGTVWVVLVDHSSGYTIEVFHTEIKAFKYAVEHILETEQDSMESKHQKAFKVAVRKSHLDEAMEVYNEALSDYGSERKMAFFSIEKKFVK